MRIERDGDPDPLRSFEIRERGGDGGTEDGGGEAYLTPRGAAGGKKAYTFLFSAIISISMWIYARTYTAPVRRGPRASRNL